MSTAREDEAGGARSAVTQKRSHRQLVRVKGCERHDGSGHMLGHWRAALQVIDEIKLKIFVCAFCEVAEALAETHNDSSCPSRRDGGDRG